VRNGTFPSRLPVEAIMFCNSRAQFQCVPSQSDHLLAVRGPSDPALKLPTLGLRMCRRSPSQQVAADATEACLERNTIPGLLIRLVIHLVRDEADSFPEARSLGVCTRQERIWQMRN
jgi:hypothetical protein